MEDANTCWENEPRAGWAEFQDARQRVADLMWIDSQLHNSMLSEPFPDDEGPPRSPNDQAAHSPGA